MLNKQLLKQLLTATLLSSALTACGDADDAIDAGSQLLTCDIPNIPNADGSACVAPPPIECPVPKVPDENNEACIIGFNPDAPAAAVMPGDNQSVLYFNLDSSGAGAQDTRAADYDGWELHTWNNAECDSYADDSIASGWSNGLVHDGIDPTYGAYWILNLKEGYGECGNMIVHKGDEKALGSVDKKIPLMQDDPTFVRANFSFFGDGTVYEFPVPTLGEPRVKIEDSSAHWIDANTIVWGGDTSNVDHVKLHFSATAGIEANDASQFSGTVLDLTEVDLTDAQKAIDSRVAQWPAYSGDWDAAAAKGVLKNQVVLVAYNADGEAITASHVQTARVLDALYASGEADADDATLGLTYSDTGIDVALWAPTAQSVTLQVFNADKTLNTSYAMTEDAVTGIWRYAGSSDLDRMFYRFELTVYHHQNAEIETVWTTDPYSVSLATNGRFSQFADLMDADLYPEGWDAQTVATLANPEDAVIYEGHVRDFSALDESTSEANRGKYLAFTEMESAPSMHLKGLADAGVSYFHLLPTNDIATVNEDPTRSVTLNSTVADFCAVKRDAALCNSVADQTQTLQQLIESQSVLSTQVADVMNQIRGYDSYNWGYDPKHFNVPEGSYASDADGVARIVEKRAMVKALHDMGLRVAMDVVYNHTNSAGLYDNSVFDKVVPGYYHARDLMTGAVQQSTCCNDTALTHKMMDKFMRDSLVLWSQHYGVDAFRFDIMSHGSVEQMLSVRDLIESVDEDVYFYGEGWYKGNESDRGFVEANQQNLAGSEIGTFNDRLRDAVRYGDLFSNKDSSNAGELNSQDIIRLGMAGTMADFTLTSNRGNAATGSSYNPSSYAKDPADIINYISKHDGLTLWDMLQLQLPKDLTLAQRVRAQNLSHSIVLLSQGIPFLQMGGDFLRSKSLDRNTYDAGDWYNRVDFTLTDNNWNKGLPIEYPNDLVLAENQKAEDKLANMASTIEMTPSSDDMQYAANVFKEYLAIRMSSPLFRLTNAQDIIDRVGFHNIGKRQQQGLIVMSIDDGSDWLDLDANYDAVVVVVNGTNAMLSHEVTTASGFIVHTDHANSVDSAFADASFSEDADTAMGTFTVPAMSTVVFVKPQGDAQGTGLSALATAGQPDVVPFADTTMYVKGEMNGWSNDDAMTYAGGGIYRLVKTLAVGSYQFKVADADWTDNFTFGAAAESDPMAVAVASTLASPGDNLAIEITEETEYLFELDASDTSAPVLTIKPEEPYYGTTVYLRGGMTGWGTDNPFIYQGNGVYQLAITMAAGDYEFKAASEDWDTVNLGAADGDVDVLFMEEQLVAQGSQDNMKLTVPVDGDYLFMLNASNSDELVISVFSAKLYGDTPLYLRGSLNSWGTDNLMEYVGEGKYQTELELAAGDYEFKFADAEWAEVNVGAAEDGSDMVVLGESLTLEKAGNPGNLKLTVVNEAPYVFTLVGPNPNAPVVTVAAKAGSVVDSDNDGVADTTDAFPNDATETVDTDNDGTGDNADTDDDNDGVSDDEDAYPLDETRSALEGDIAPYQDKAIYLKGDMNDWTNDNQMVYVGNGVYQVAMTLEAKSYGFKVADADWTTPNLGAVDSGTVVLGEALGVVHDSQTNLALEIVDAGDYIFQLHAGDSEALSIKVLKVNDTIGSGNIYVRGSMTGDWAARDMLVYQGAGIYRAVMDLAAGDYEFKVSNDDWSANTYGAVTGDDMVTVATAHALTTDDSQNMKVTIIDTVSYTFTFDISDASNPKMTIEATKMFADTTIYVKGDMNSWGIDNPMQYSANSVYSLELPLAAGTYGFKVADESWTDTINFGSAEGQDGTIVLGQGMMLSAGGSSGNLSLTLAADATVRFTLAGPSASTPALTVSVVPQATDESAAATAD